MLSSGLGKIVMLLTTLDISSIFYAGLLTGSFYSRNTLPRVLSGNYRNRP